MKPSAVLLIDLENFYCSREDYCGSSPSAGYDRVRFAYDLDKLLGFARTMADGLPFTVRRAYANFNAARYPGGAPPHYFLRHIPDELMRQGVEPVQVFRLSQSSSKNAADMRMAMDATALVNGVGNVEHFILVTGDADFIPVILELKRHGYTVSVIGVTGATNALIQRFVDTFELFEDLLAAEEVEARSGELAQCGDGLARVVDAVRNLLNRTHPLRFAAVKPLLSKELGHPFDPGVFGCDTTGEFLRKYQAELGVVIRPTQHDQEIDLPGAGPAGPNGSNGAKAASRPTGKPAERPAKPPAAQPEPHSREHYLALLTGRGQAESAVGSVRVPAVSWPVLVWGCDAMATLLAPPLGAPTHTTSLLPKLLQATEGAAIADLVKHIRLFYPILRAGLPVQGADGVYSLPPEITGEQIRRSVIGYVGYVLGCRLAENGVAGEVRADSLAAVFEPGEAFEQAKAEVAAALAQPAPAPPPPEPQALQPKPASAEEMHTPAGYMKLLKAGGAKGSATESFKILPVPWPSVQRVCEDLFPILSPTTGGGPTARDQLYNRLTEVGKDLYIERYDQHVRRALGILRVASELVEDNGVLTLNPDVTTAADLRNRALAFLLQLLQLRLEERGIYDPIHPQPFVTALEAGPLTDALLEEVKPTIELLYREADAGEADAGEADTSEADTGEADAGALHSGATEGDSRVDLGRDSPDGIDESASTRLSTQTIPDGAHAEEPVDAVLLSSESDWQPDAGGAAVLGSQRPETDASEPAPGTPTGAVESPPEQLSAPPPEDQFSSESEIVDVASLTREAVAAAAIEIQPLPASQAEPPLSTTPVAAVQRNEVAVADGLLLPVPVADWLSDEGSLQPEGTLAEQMLSPVPLAINALPPPHDQPNPLGVAKIALPVPVVIPSPPAPPPSESA